MYGRIIGMKLKYKFETVDMGDEVCAVPVGDNCGDFHGVLQLNSSGARMLGYIAECETPDEVLAKLADDYPDGDINEIKESLNGFIKQLTEEGLLIP